MKRTGFTQIELLVAITIIAILLAIIIPAVQSVRETARNTACRNHLRQFGTAMHSFESAHGVYPPGREHYWTFQSNFYTLLPYLGMQPLFNQFDYSWRGTEPEFQALQRLAIPILHCPSESVSQLVEGGPARTSYAWNYGTGKQRYGYNGMFRPLIQFYPAQNFRWGPIGPADVRDGLSNTAAIAEWVHTLPHGEEHWLRTTWMTPETLIEPSQLEEFAALCASVPENAANYGWRGGGGLGSSWLYNSAPATMYNHVLTPGSPSCTNGTKVQEGAYTANSLHPATVNVLYVDGHVAGVSRDIDLQVWRELGSRVEHDLIFPLD